MAYRGLRVNKEDEVDFHRFMEVLRGGLMESREALPRASLALSGRRQTRPPLYSGPKQWLRPAVRGRQAAGNFWQVAEDSWQAARASGDFRQAAQAAEDSRQAAGDCLPKVLFRAAQILGR